MPTRRFLLLAILTFLGPCLTATAAPANDPIPTAIAKGAKYLEWLHRPQPQYIGGGNGMGSACLAGLALLESGVKESNPSLRNIIAFVRGNALSQTRTYETALTIMLLDQLGTLADRHMIQLLGVRLKGGQNEAGGWSYDCGYPLTPQDEARLRSLFLRETGHVLRTPGAIDSPPKVPVQGDVPRTDLPVVEGTTPPDKTPPKKDPAPARKLVNDMPALHPEVARFAKLVNEQAGKNPGIQGMGGDNSNTQFAALGLWCARKHGVPCDDAFARLAQRFLQSQDLNSGGWVYSYASGGRSGAAPAMTCSGLLGLAAAQGSAQHALRNRPDSPKLPQDGADMAGIPGADVAIVNGLKCLGNFIGQARGQGFNGISDLSANLYFMWSLERVGVIYGLETIGKQDWYAWGSDALVRSQQPDGSWTGAGYPGANNELSTCFALLFLCRANVARDLTAHLKGKFKDPGQAELRGGGAIDKSIIPNLPVATADPRPLAQDLQSKPSSGTHFDDEARRLCDEVLKASADARGEVISHLREGKGSVYTQALAEAAAQLTADSQRETRDALAHRLTRMTATTLRNMLRDEDREVRRAAILACGMKGDRQFALDLIDELSDADALIVAAAHTSLRTLSGEDFGPAADAAAGDKVKAIVAWREWAKQAEK